MSEDSVHIKVGGKDFELNRDNGSVFTFAGELAMYNHVFLQTAETVDHEDGTFGAQGTYIFSEAGGWEELVEYMVAQDYPAHLNMRGVPDCDKEAWGMYYLSDLQEPSFPEGWSTGGAES